MATNDAVAQAHEKTAPLNEVPTTQDSFNKYRIPDAPGPGASPATEKTPSPQEPKELTMEPLKVPGWDGQNQNKAAGSNDSSTEKSLITEQTLKRPDLSPSQELILDAAKSGVGKDLWKGSEQFAGVTQNGKLGAAVSISEVMKDAGYPSINSPSISGLEQQAKDAGFQEKSLAEVKPGDMVVYQLGDSSKRVGIAGDPDNGKPTIYQMDRNGTWRHHQMRTPDAQTKVKVYSPPGTCLE